MNSHSDESRISKAAPRKRRTWIMSLSVALVLLAGAFLWAPALVMQTPLRQSILGYVLGPYPADVEVQSATLNWSQPVQLENVILYDLESRPFLEMRSVETQQSLWALLTGQPETIQLRCVQPVLRLRMTDAESNASRLIKAYLDDDQWKSSDVSEMSIELVDGVVMHGDDRRTGMDVQGINGRLDFQDTGIRSSLAASFSDGRIRAQPQLLFQTNRLSLSDASEASFEGLRIRPEKVDGWLGFVAPLLSGTTRTSGTLSGKIHSLDIPLDQPENGSFQGQLQIEAGRIDAGPLSQAVINVGRRLYAILEEPAQGELPEGERWHVELPAQTVDFEMRDGAVRHNSLTANVAGLTLTTAGSVSFNENLNLSLATDIPESWVAESQWLEELANEKLLFEIDGTLSSPNLNDAALARLVERLGTKLVLESVIDVAEEPMLDLLGF